MPNRNYTDLIAWQKAMTLAESVYRATAVMPPEEQYGLTSQMRRTAASIPSNIAEGPGMTGYSFCAMAHVNMYSKNAARLADC